MTTKELITLAKELSELDELKSRAKDVALLKKEAKSILNRDYENYAAQQEAEELGKYYDIIASKESSLMTSIYEEKKELVNKARSVLNNEKNMKKATQEINDIFNQFKEIGHCSKEQDDQLWSDMKAIRDEFSTKRQKFYDELKDANAKNKAAKEDLINKAKAVLEIEDLSKASNEMNQLMNEWKTLGFTGSKEVDDALWNEFNASRNALNAKRKAYYDSMQATYDERAAKKEELIKKAKVVLANSEFTKEEVETLKTLRAEWKTIGFAGKDKDDALWNEFNTVVNKYFKNMRSYR